MTIYSTCAEFYWRLCCCGVFSGSGFAEFHPNSEPITSMNAHSSTTGPHTGSMKWTLGRGIKCSMYCISSEFHAFLLLHPFTPSLHPLPHTPLSMLSGCPHASLPGAASTVTATLHHTQLYLLCCTYVRARLRQRVKRRNYSCVCKLCVSICVQVG